MVFAFSCGSLVPEALHARTEPLVRRSTKRKRLCLLTILFTSESVSEGHPDKLADQISDAVLDAIIKDDPHSRVAVETMVKTGMTIIAGEVRTDTYVDLEQIVRDVITGMGYDQFGCGFRRQFLCRTQRYWQAVQ